MALSKTQSGVIEMSDIGKDIDRAMEVSFDWLHDDFGSRLARAHRESEAAGRVMDGEMAVYNAYQQRCIVILLGDIAKSLRVMSEREVE